MKKDSSIKKLNLNKTTLRILCREDLENVGGGLAAAASECGSCNSCPDASCSACPTTICPTAAAIV
jgi:hypothetical protein